MIKFWSSYLDLHGCLFLHGCGSLMSNLSNLSNLTGSFVCHPWDYVHLSAWQKNLKQAIMLALQVYSVMSAIGASNILLKSPTFAFFALPKLAERLQKVLKVTLYKCWNARLQYENFIWKFTVWSQNKYHGFASLNLAARNSQASLSVRT